MVPPLLTDGAQLKCCKEVRPSFCASYCVIVSCPRGLDSTVQLGGQGACDCVVGAAQRVCAIVRGCMLSASCFCRILLRAIEQAQSIEIGPWCQSPTLRGSASDRSPTIIPQFWSKGGWVASAFRSWGQDCAPFPRRQATLRPAYSEAGGSWLARMPGCRYAVQGNRI